MFWTDARPRDQARRRPHAAVGPPRRADLRRQLRRSRGRAGARRKRRGRPRRRPLRDRRAPDVRVRRADRLAAQPGARRVDPPDVRRARRPPPRPHPPLAAAVYVLDLRLPHAVRAAGGLRAPARGRPDFAFETAKVERIEPGERPPRPHRPRRPSRPARRRRARLAARARHRRRRRRPAAGGAALARAGGPPRGPRRRTSSCGSTAATCARATGGASRPGDELRVGVGSFEPRDHVKDPTVRLAADVAVDRRRLPGQLDPPRAAPGGRATACSSWATARATACR